MGGLFGGNGLTKFGVQQGGAGTDLNPSGGGPTKYFNSEDEAMSAANDKLKKSGALAGPNYSLDGGGKVIAIKPGTEEKPQGIAGPGEAGAPDIQFESPKLNASSVGPMALSRVVKPSFQEAGTDSAGAPAAVTPGLTKMGKLLEIVGSAARGGAAGYRSHEGFGGGFRAAEELPLQVASEKAKVGEEQAQSQLTGAEAQSYPQKFAQQSALVQSEIGRNNADTAMTGEQAKDFAARTDLTERKANQPTYEKQPDGTILKIAPDGSKAETIGTPFYRTPYEMLAYGDPNSPEYKNAYTFWQRGLAAKFSGSGRADAKQQFENDVRDVYGAALSNNGNNTRKAIADLGAKLQNPQLSERARQATTQALIQLRQSGLAAQVTR
jgi:hypothetical protein